MASVNCPDCGADLGQPHVDDCDVARCLWTGRQRLDCEGRWTESIRVLQTAGRSDLASQLADYLDVEEDHICGQDVWDGEFPGISDAARLDLWCYGPPWRACSRNHPGATEDLNRLYTQAEWDRANQQWRMR